MPPGKSSRRHERRERDRAAESFGLVGAQLERRNLEHPSPYGTRAGRLDCEIDREMLWCEANGLKRDAEGEPAATWTETDGADRNHRVWSELMSALRPGRHLKDRVPSREWLAGNASVTRCERCAVRARPVSYGCISCMIVQAALDRVHLMLKRAPWHPEDARCRAGSATRRFTRHRATGQDQP